MLIRTYDPIPAVGPDFSATLVVYFWPDRREYWSVTGFLSNGRRITDPFDVVTAIAHRRMTGRPVDFMRGSWATGVPTLHPATADDFYAALRRHTAPLVNPNPAMP